MLKCSAVSLDEVRRRCGRYRFFGRASKYISGKIPIGMTILVDSV